MAKTTTAIHIADYFNDFAPTLFVDFGYNKSATKWHSRGKFRFPVVGQKPSLRQARKYGHIIVDAAAKDGEIRNIVVGSSLVIVPTTPDMLALEATLETVDAIQGVGVNHFGVLLTIVPPAPSRDGEEAREAIEKADFPLFETRIRSFVAFKRAAQIGCVVGEVSGDPHAADGATDYLALGREILRASAT